MVISAYKAGDVISAVKGAPVLIIEKYMLRLTQLHVGELVEVEVMRGILNYTLRIIINYTI